jgi:hypothetical protein
VVAITTMRKHVTPADEVTGRDSEAQAAVE